MQGRLLGIDHGLKRLGLAVCDASWLVARELTIIQRRSRVEDFDDIRRIIAEQHIVAVIVGVPTNYEALPGQQDQAATVRKWAARLAEAAALPVVLWDEQLSTSDARDLARQQRRKPSARVDDLAARVILQSYIDAVRDGLAEPPSFGPPTE
jgi:putative Holliday junction resolvase